MILASIDKTNCSIKIVSLLSSEEELRKRLMKGSQELMEI